MSPLEQLILRMGTTHVSGGIYDKRGKCVSWNEDWVKLDDLKREATRLELFELLRPQPQMKTVFQWRYKNNEQTHWKVAKSLLTYAEAEAYYVGCDIQKHAGPFEVPFG